MKSSVFWDETPCSQLKFKRRFGGQYSLYLQRRSISQVARSMWQEKQNISQISCLAYSSILKMEVTCSSEISVDFQRTTWRCIPEDRTFHKHRDNLKSYKIIYIRKEY
jgi:hypothetical protein